MNSLRLKLLKQVFQGLEPKEQVSFSKYIDKYYLVLRDRIIRQKNKYFDGFCKCWNRNQNYLGIEIRDANLSYSYESKLLILSISYPYKKSYQKGIFLLIDCKNDKLYTEIDEKTAVTLLSSSVEELEKLTISFTPNPSFE